MFTHGSWLHDDLCGLNEHADSHVTLSWGLIDLPQIIKLLPSSHHTHQVAVGRVVVLHGSEAHKAVFVDVDSEGVTRCDQHVNPKVKLEAVNDERLRAESESGCVGE